MTETTAPSYSSPNALLGLTIAGIGVLLRQSLLKFDQSSEKLLGMRILVAVLL